MDETYTENSTSSRSVSNFSDFPVDYFHKKYEISETLPTVNFTANVILLEEYPPSLLLFGAVCCFTFTAVGIPANAVTIAALLKSRRLRIATSAFIINLCFADIVYCSLTIPLYALTLLNKGWPYGDMLCVTFAVSRHSNAAVLLLTLVDITVNRYILIVHPKVYCKIYTRFTIIVLIAFTWIMPFVLLAPTATRMWGSFDFDPQLGECTIVQLKGKSSKSFIYIFLFCLPSFVFIFCYTRIFCTVRNSEKAASKMYSVSMIKEKVQRTWYQKLIRCCVGSNAVQTLRLKKRAKKEMRVLRVTLVIFLMFVVCYIPISVVKILQKEQCYPVLNVLGYIAQYFSACVNPVIYVVMSGEYRKSYKNLCFGSENNDIQRRSSY